MATKINDHVERAKARLLGQYKGKPKIEGLVEVQATLIQELEDAAFEFFEKVALPTATGAQLDRLGAVVGQEREGRTDEVYRVWIGARLQLNQGSATVPEILNLLTAISPAGATVQVLQSFPAEFQVSLLGVVTTATLAGQLLRILKLAKGGGIRVVLYWEPAASGALFRFDSGPGFDVGLFAGVAE